MAGPWDIVGDVASGIARGAREVAGVFDIGEPSGNDHASSNWAAWGHDEIRSMLDTSVEPSDINDVARSRVTPCQPNATRARRRFSSSVEPLIGGCAS